ncbi:MAG: hypothetical protein MSS90_08430, partial [Blautia massiliensis]|uniref:hypothetical protein n=1 Tax=Blautia massiliensis (ex Durand et al. 2017) TaxID=1737424 RepID=UPI00242B4549
HGINLLFYFGFWTIPLYQRIVFMPFLLAEILDFQGSAHLIGVGSLSKKYFSTIKCENQQIQILYGNLYIFVADS